MKKKTLRTLLSALLMALCIINTKMPTISSVDHNNTLVQVMPCSDIDDYYNKKDK